LVFNPLLNIHDVIAVSLQRPQEIFNVEKEDEKTRWIEKLNEAIVAAKQV